MLSTVLLFREALYGALVIALACSVIGVYVVLRRIVFVGAAIAQLSSAGIALALFLAGTGIIGSFAGHTTTFSLAFALAGAMFFGLGGGQRAGVPPDATIGVGYAVAAAAGILLISKAASGEAHDIFLSGNILGITRADTLVLLAVTIPVLVVHALFYFWAAGNLMRDRRVDEEPVAGLDRRRHRRFADHDPPRSTSALGEGGGPGAGAGRGPITVKPRRPAGLRLGHRGDVRPAGR